MKVKILSMHRVVNYGSFMQAYALRAVISSMGHSVSFADFKPGMPRHVGEKIKTSTFRERLCKIPSTLLNPVSYLKKKSFRKKLRNTYVLKAWPLLNISDEHDLNYECDAFVIGSDEVFNYTQNHVFGYVPAFFGHGLKAKSIISYAASAGYATPQDVENDGMAKELKSGFSKFDALSVRDQNTFELVSKYWDNSPTMVIDPTLLYDFDDEVPSQVIPSNYLLVYAYDGRLDDPADVSLIRSFANQQGLRIVSVGFYHDWCDENLVVSPFEILSVFKYAAFVITDTFHGTIFSIKNKKQFVSLLRGENRWGSNSNKLGFLLSQLNLSSRVNNNLAELSEHLLQQIDYISVDKLLITLREDSLRFLSISLKNAADKLEQSE